MLYPSSLIYFLGFFFPFSQLVLQFLVPLGHLSHVFWMVFARHNCGSSVVLSLNKVLASRGTWVSSSGLCLLHHFRGHSLHVLFHSANSCDSSSLDSSLAPLHILFLSPASLPCFCLLGRLSFVTCECTQATTLQSCPWCHMFCMSVLFGFIILCIRL